MVPVNHHNKPEFGPLVVAVGSCGKAEVPVTVVAGVLVLGMLSVAACVDDGAHTRCRTKLRDSGDEPCPLSSLIRLQLSFKR